MQAEIRNRGATVACSIRTARIGKKWYELEDSEFEREAGHKPVALPCLGGKQCEKQGSVSA